MGFRISTLRVVGAALCGVAFAAPLAAVAGPWAENEQARVRLVSRWVAAAPGSDAGLGLEYRLAPGWHVYWLNPGDAGYPPKLTLTSGPVSAPQLRYPAPHRFDLPGGLVSFGYGDEVIYPLDATLAADAGSLATLAAEIDYLVCAEQCIPYRQTVTLEMPVAATAVEDPEIAPAVDRWRARLPRPLASVPGARVDAALRPATGPELDLDLALAAPELAATADLDLFFAPHPLLVVERPAPRSADGAAAAWRVHLRPLDETKPLPARLELAWTAAGLALGGAPVALEGTLALDRPSSSAAMGAPLRRAIAVAAVALVAYLIYRRLRAAPPSLAS
jgi:DsbC/DsbD-like thiol-disulfide interchange protein